MNKKFIIAWIIVFVVWMGGSFVVHGLLLESSYQQMPNLFRAPADSEKYMHLMLLAHILLAGAFVWIYERGRESKPWFAQGLRFGIAVAFLTAIPMYTIYYVVQPMPGMLAVKQIVYETALLLIVGTVAAFLAKDSTPATA